MFVYINREHLITINSGDRDWFNNTNETRFSFQVKFSNTDNHASIKNIFKNVVSIEMVRVLLSFHAMQVDTYRDCCKLVEEWSKSMSQNI